MRVAIDIRRAGDFGFGTYIRNIVNQFARTDSETDIWLGGPGSQMFGDEKRISRPDFYLPATLER